MKTLSDVTNYLNGHGFTPCMKSADGTSVTYSNTECNAVIEFIEKDGELRFKVFAMLPKSMCRVQTDFIQFGDRKDFLWKCVSETHNAIHFYKLHLGE